VDRHRSRGGLGQSLDDFEREPGLSPLIVVVGGMGRCAGPCAGLDCGRVGRSDEPCECESSCLRRNEQTEARGGCRGCERDAADASSNEMSLELVDCP
jgi:hypothetical protein